MYRGDAGGYKDGPVYAANSWTGFYVGGHAGSAWGHVNVRDFIENGSVDDKSSNDPSGVFGGAQAGYNIQHGRFVYGAEIDLGGMGISGSKTNIDTLNRQETFSNSSGFMAISQDAWATLGIAF